MPRWSRPLFFSVAACTALRLGLAAADPAPAPSPIHTEALPRVTLELNDATITEAAERISEATRLQLHVPPEQGANFGAMFDVVARHAQPAVDYSRKAHLSWKGASLSTVFREFARTYHCRLVPSVQTGYIADVGVMEGEAAVKPTVQTEGYEVGVAYVAMQSHGFRWANADRGTGRNLHLEFTVRALNGDPCAVVGMANVRATDASGRTYRDEEESDEDGPASIPENWHGLWPLPYPDELLCPVNLDWPYPGSGSFRTLEGDLLLSKRVRRFHHEFPMPEGRGRPVIDREGEIIWEFDWLTPSPAGFERNLKITVPKSYGKQFLYENPRRLSILCADGSQVLPDQGQWNQWDQGGASLFWSKIRVHTLPAPPVKLIWEPVLRSTQANALRRVHFRLENVPAHLDQGEDAPREKPKPAAPARKPVAPKGGRKA